MTSFQEALKRKLDSLMRYRDLTSEYALSIADRSIDDLQTLQIKRDLILRAQAIYDRDIKNALNSLGKLPAEDLRIQFSHYAEQRAVITEEIARYDGVILEWISKESNRIKDQIKSAKIGRELVSKFHSGDSVPGGKRIDSEL